MGQLWVPRENRKGAEMVALGMREEKAAPTDSIICLTHSGFRKYEDRNKEEISVLFLKETKLFFF